MTDLVEPTLPVSAAGPPESSRQWWIDNLRVAVIAAVIAAHSAITYIVDYDWYYDEKTASPVSEVVLGLLVGPGLLFAMGVLFLVAGMLSPASLARKGAWPFTRDRLVRLGIPLVAVTVVLLPVADLIGAWAEGGQKIDDPVEFLVDSIRTLETGWMWFVGALLVFSVVYAVWRRARPAVPVARPGIRLRHLAVAAATIAVGSFAVRLVWAIGDDTPLMLNLWEWPQMATLFALGVLAGERGWFDPMPDRQRRGFGRAALLSGAVALLAFAAYGLSEDESFLGGWHLQALLLPVAEATLALAMSLWLVGWFPRRWNQHGPLARTLARASYAAYVLHALVIVILGAGLSSVAIVAEVKFIVVAVVGVVASFTAGWLATRVGPLARIL
jgi:hypothetical protein